MNRLLILILVLISQRVSAQHAVMIASSRYSIDYTRHEGYVILINGQKITGIFQYAVDEFPSYNIKYYSLSGKLQNRIKAKKIARIVLKGGDTTLLINDSTIFVHLKDNDRYLYRQLTNGSIKIYDRLFNVNEKPGLIGPELMVVIDGKTHETQTVNQLADLLKNNDFPIHKSKNLTLKKIIRDMNSSK